MCIIMTFFDVAHLFVSLLNLFVEIVICIHLALLARLFVDFAKSLSAWKGIARGAASP